MPDDRPRPRLPRCGCTWSPARAAPARPRSLPRSRWRSPPRASGCCSPRSRGARGSRRLFDVPPLAVRPRRGSPTAAAAARSSAISVDAKDSLLRVPPDVLQGRQGGDGARPVRRGRLRHDDRARACATSCSSARSTRRRSPHGTGPAAPAYDAVVLDAPPTGRIGRFLNVNAEVADVAKVGPIRNQADSITADAAVATRPRCTSSRCSRRCPCRRPSTPSPSCGAPDLPLGGIVVNQVRDPLLPASALAAAAAGGPPSWPTGSRRTWPPRARATTAGRAACSPRPPTTPTGSPSRREQDATRPARPADLPAAAAWPRHRRRRDLRARRPARRAGDGLMAATRPHRARGAKRRRLDLDALLDRPGTRIVVCCGSGGVGKTTTAAALGLRAAEHGRKVVVLTIDPARRLAQSLGLTELDNTPRPVAGVDAAAAAAALDAMMLDMKRTFDEVVERTPTPKGRADPGQPLLPGRLQLVRRHAGVHGDGEARPAARRGRPDGRWDLIVVDTPPSRSALDFLDAPKRLGSFLDGRFIRLLTAPAKAGGRAVLKVVQRRGAALVTSTLTKVLGGQLLRTCRRSWPPSTRCSAGSASAPTRPTPCCKDAGTAFVVVAAPERDALREASLLRRPARRGAYAARRPGRSTGSTAWRRTSLSASRALAAAEQLADGGGGHGGSAEPTGCCACTPPGRDRRRRRSSWPGGSPPATPGSRWSRCPRAAAGHPSTLEGLRAVRGGPRGRLSGGCRGGGSARRLRRRSAGGCRRRGPTRTTCATSGCRGGA